MKKKIQYILSLSSLEPALNLTYTLAVIRKNEKRPRCQLRHNGLIFKWYFKFFFNPLNMSYFHFTCPFKNNWSRTFPTLVCWLQCQLLKYSFPQFYSFYPWHITQSDLLFHFLSIFKIIRGGIIHLSLQAIDLSAVSNLLNHSNIHPFTNPLSPWEQCE